MVAEQDCKPMTERIEALELDKEMHDTKIQDLQYRMKKFDEWQIDFGDALQPKIANIALMRTLPKAV